jgi:hypothetical protein
MISVTLLLTLTICTCAFAQPPADQHVPKYKQTRETVTVDKPLQLPGLDNLILRIVKDKQTPIEYEWTILQNGVEKAKLPDWWSGGTGHTKVVAQDLDGDKRLEVLVYRYGSGSGGVIALNVYRSGKGRWQELLSALPDWQHENTRFQVRYIGNNEVEFRDFDTGMRARIPIDPSRYQDMMPNLQKSGETLDEFLSKHIRDWVDPWSSYKVTDVDQNGIKEIVAYQDVVGYTHPDRLATLATQFELKNGRYQPTLYTLYELNQNIHCNLDQILAQVQANHSKALP